MKKFILLSVLFVCARAFSQAPDTTRPLQRLFTYVEYQNIFGVNGGLRIPRDTLKFKSGDTGYIAYKNGLFIWKGNNWVPISGAGGDISGKLNISDTSSMLLAYKNGLLTKLRIQDTAAMLNNYQSLLAIKVKYSDTANMLANYQSGLNNRATVTQLNNAEALDVKYTDTSNMLANYKNGLNLRLKYTDTAAMFAAHPVTGFDTTGKFTAYQAAINARALNSAAVKYADTSSMLAAYASGLNARTTAIALKLNISDTASMFAAHPSAGGSSAAKADTAAIAQTADYVIEKVGSTYFARPRYKSGLALLSNSDAYTVIQGAVTALTPAGSQGTGGGLIFLMPGTYSLSNEITIAGWETDTQPFAQLQIIGSGYATRIIQNTAGKNAFLVKNSASITLKNMFITVGSLAASGIYLSDAGASYEISVWNGTIDNIRIESTGTAPGFYARNFFNLQVPHLDVECTTNHGVLLQGTSTVTNYGNSNFGFLHAVGSTSYPYAALALISDVNNHPINFISFNQLDVGGGYYGLYGRGAADNTVLLADIEYLSRPVWFEGGGTGVETHDNKIVSGFLYANVGGIAIHCSNKTSGNDISAYVESNDNTLMVIRDSSTSRAANSYNIRTGYYIGATPNIYVASPLTTSVKVRKVFDGLTTMSGPYVTPDLTALTQNVRPSTGNTRDLGESSNYYWANVYTQNLRANYILSRSAQAMEISSGSSSTGINFDLNNTATKVGTFYGTTGNLGLQNGGTFTDIPTARLSINSTTQGFLPPRMTGAQMAAISSPATGLMVYNTDSLAFCYYNASAWVKVAASAGGASFDTTGKFGSYQNAINARLKISDTATMLGAYQTALNARTAAIALKLNISDTASMLTAYQASLNGKLNNDTSKFVNVTGAQNIPFYKSFTDTWANGQIRAGQTGQAGNITLYDGSTGAAQFLIRYTNATSTQANIISTSSAGLSLTNTGPSGNILMGATGTTASSLQFQVGSSQTARNFLSGNWQFQDAGTFTDIASAKVSINSTSKGFLPPRMTGAQMAAISSPATGLMVYNTDSVAFCYYNSSAWVKIGAATGGGSFDTTGQFNSYQNAINARLKISDTSSMLTPYQNGLNARTAAIALKLNISDTSAMLGAYATGLNARTVAIALKVNISDTSSMLTAYRNGLNAKVNVSDTASMLTNYRNAINGKLNISDTAAMHTAYQVALNLRAPLASPALTGNPTAPTQTLTDSTTKLATTAFARQILQTAKNYADTGSNTIYIDTTTLAGGASSANPLKVKTGIQTLTDGATITFDCRKSYTATVTLGGNRTLSVTNIAAGTFITLKVVQDATGSRTLTLPAGSKVISGGAGAVTLTTTANAVDVLSALYDGTNYFWNIGKNYN